MWIYRPKFLLEEIRWMRNPNRRLKWEGWKSLFSTIRLMAELEYYGPVSTTVLCVLCRFKKIAGFSYLFWFNILVHFVMGNRWTIKSCCFFLVETGERHVMKCLLFLGFALFIYSEQIIIWSGKKMNSVEEQFFF